jgi:hypothetical protein
MFNLNKQLTNCLLATLMALFSTLAWSENPARQGAKEITVYKSATCTCCKIGLHCWDCPHPVCQ